MLDNSNAFIGVAIFFWMVNRLMASHSHFIGV